MNTSTPRLQLHVLFFCAVCFLTFAAAAESTVKRERNNLNVLYCAGSERFLFDRETRRHRETNSRSSVPAGRAATGKRRNFKSLHGENRQPGNLPETLGVEGSSAAGRVWKDLNYDGIQDDPALESGCPDVSVELLYAGSDGVFEADGDDQVQLALTGNDGVYRFDNLLPGNYRVRLAQLPDDYVLTLDGQGTDEALDSDGTPFAEFTVTDLEGHGRIDFGIAPAPNIEAVLAVSGVDFPASNSCGHFTLLLDAEIHNTGKTPLQDLQAVAALAALEAFGSAFVGLAAAPQFLSHSQAQSLPLWNTAFDGAGDPNLFDGNSGRLQPGEFLAIRFAVEVHPEATGAPEAPAAHLQVEGTAINKDGLLLPDYQSGASSLVVRDWSDNSLALNGTYEDGDQPTPLGDCWKSAKDLAANAQVNVSVDGSCSVFLTPEMLLANFAAECGSDALPQGGYYRLFRNGTEITGPAEVSHLIGQTLDFEVKSVLNPCAPVTGTVLFEDKTPPVTECPGEVYLICSDLDSVLSNAATLDPESPLFTGLPRITDNCTEVDQFTWSDQLLFFGCPEGEVKNGDGQPHYAAILRTFKATDAQGNVSPGCKQIIYLDRPLYEEPPATVQLDFCREDFPLDEQGHPHPQVTGYPFYVNGFGDTVRLSRFQCNYSTAYQDQFFEGPCAGAYKVIRRWTVSDWCGSDGTRSFDQVIEVGDFSAPMLACTTVDAVNGDTLTYSTGPFNCTAAFLIPEPDISGECSGYQLETAVYAYRRPTDPFGNPYGDPEFVKLEISVSNGVASGVPPGVNYFVYTLTDACNNVVVSDPCVFKVADKVEPVAICGNNLNVSLGGSGLARLIPSDIDKGSRDNCGDVRLELRRPLPEACLNTYLQSFFGVSIEDLQKINNAYLLAEQVILLMENGTYYTPWKEDVFLTCWDIGTLVPVELLVIDGAGNKNTCEIAVAVEDKIAPQCLPPSDREVDCTALERTGLHDTIFLQERFGQVEVLDNCIAASRELSPLIDLDDCGAGTITRRFEATDPSGNSSGICQQLITVRQVNDYLLRFPADAGTGQCGSITADTFYYEEGACDLLAVNIEETTFDGSGEACFNIFRTYRVINWCEYDGVSTPLVIGRKEDQNAGAGEKAVFLVRTPEGAAFIDNNSDPADGYLRQVNSQGFWQYTQVIQVFDQSAPEVITEATAPFCSWNGLDDCTGTAEIKFVVMDSCSATGMQVRIDFDEGADGRADLELTNTSAVQKNANEYTVISDFPIGKHRLIVRATDGCGNLTVREIPFRIVDCKAPAPVCIRELAVELMPVDSNDDGQPDTAFAVLNVNNLMLSGSSGDCSGEVRFSLNRAGRSPDREQSTLIFTCQDAGTTVFVELYAWDEADNPYALQPDSTLGGPNYDFCTITVEVQDNQNLCVAPAAIAGRITTEQGESIRGAKVQLSGQMTMEYTTGSDGSFHFPGLEQGYDYSVTPGLNAHPLNGVSTLDLVRISKHILGVQYLDSPYKVIAADANGSGSVSTLDMIQLRKLILGLIREIPGSPSWRFIDRRQTFADTLRPWQDGLAEIMNFNDLQEPATNADFIAVKVGDVNGSATVDNLAAALPRGSRQSPFLIYTQDGLLESGSEVLVSFSAEDLDQIEGFQFSLQWDPSRAEVDLVEDGLLQPSNFGFFAREGILTASWHPHAQGLPNDERAKLFSLRVQSDNDLRLSDMFQLRALPTRTEAYSLQEEIRPVEFLFLQTDYSMPEAKLFQNRPNPFQRHTVIGFWLPEAMPVTITVSDTGGQILKVYSGHFAEGYNDINLSSKDLAATGVLFYTINAGGFIATKRMLVVD